MPYRLLGKFFFLFYICPRIVREFKVFRKYANPMINAIVLDQVKKQQKKYPLSDEQKACYPATK
jgi:hypothetical protein